VLLSSNTDFRYDPYNDIELLINSDNGILIKNIANKEFEFYDTGIRSLFHESIFFDIVFKDGFLYISLLNDDKEGSTVVIHYPIGKDIKYLYFDLTKSDNIHLKDIRKINFIERKYLKNIFVYHKRLQLASDAVFIEILPDGDQCLDLGKRRAIIEYRCDHTGNADIQVNIFNIT
jgi:hypothetical protein